jgi:hypothetical protein
MIEIDCDISHKPYIERNQINTDVIKRRLKQLEKLFEERSTTLVEEIGGVNINTDIVNEVLESKCEIDQLVSLKLEHILTCVRKDKWMFEK